MGIFDNISGSFSKIFDPIVNGTKQIVAPFSSVFEKGDKYITAVGNKAGDVIDKAIDLPGKIVDTAGNLGGKVIDIGGSILDKGLSFLSSPFTLIFIGVGLFLVIMLIKK